MHVGQTRFLRAVVLGLLAMALAGCFSEAARRNDNEAAVMAAKQRALANQTGSAGTTAQSPPSTPTYHPRPSKSSSNNATASTATPGENAYNIWDRIRAGLKLPLVHNPQVDGNIRWFEKRQKFLDRVVERARPYLHYIVEEIDKRHMPMELALLPVVESAYQPFAYSSGHASGLWQFTSGTARRFGLEQNWWYDGRRDVAESTRAALDYLQLLHDRFNGHWLEAIAAYNCGEANVDRAIEENRKAGKPTDFWHLNLPAETEGYVPRLLALAAIVARPSEYNLTLKSIPNRPYLASVDINGQVDLTKAARVAGLSPKTLFKLNPGFNRTVTGPHSSHSLLVPLDRAEKLAESVDELAPAKIQHGWRRYTVHRGDTLSGIASHHHISIAALRTKNRLHGTLIRAGHSLLVPAPVPPSNPLLSASARRRQDGARKLTHIVRHGDNLWTIARSYSVSVRSLCAWNDISPRSTLHPGQRLVIWRTQRTASAHHRHSVRLASAAGGRAHRPRHSANVAHVVRSGDSLWTIARSYNISVKQLCAWNGINRKAVLRPGQKLVIRHAGHAANATAANAGSGRFVTTAAEEHGAREHIRYQVRKGDSLWLISQRFSVTVAQLCKWNGLSKTDTLRPGQRLDVYVAGLRQTDASDSSLASSQG